ncbi:hypothetical protein LZ32DRAFT_112283 [Colletotrichum eremochloae]|nr:hypothetical protein LZ32DRAFT_112283 [Colletotrichum eremochloae]
MPNKPSLFPREKGIQIDFVPMVRFLPIELESLEPRQGTRLLPCASLGSIHFPLDFSSHFLDFFHPRLPLSRSHTHAPLYPHHTIAPPPYPRLLHGTTPGTSQMYPETMTNSNLPACSFYLTLFPCCCSKVRTDRIARYASKCLFPCARLKREKGRNREREERASTRRPKYLASFPPPNSFQTRGTISGLSVVSLSCSGAICIPTLSNKNTCSPPPPPPLSIIAFPPSQSVPFPHSLFCSSPPSPGTFLPLPPSDKRTHPSPLSRPLPLQ